MDKYTWKQVKALSSSSHKPSARWGHSCCVVGEDIVFFGGYADSNYMNDLWAFNSVTMKWREIQTRGDVPAQRSNCSMNYDKENNQIVIFGGGGLSKQRFNSISILNWANKEWIEITPKQNEISPWERTYHVAELIFPYLIVFGGEGVADMDDLWIFNFETLSWTEIIIPNDRVKPCARRFHSSVRMGNEFIVLAGCHNKYRCLSDVFSMDFTPLLKNGKIDQLCWKEKKFKNLSLLTRWGHSSAVYDNKIYIFGGRFSNDLNDVLVADFETMAIKQMKITGEAPAARRRHCAGFIGSSMLTFGGFNGQYFNDLHYISVHESRPKYEVNQAIDDKQLMKFINNKQFANHCIKSIDGKYFFINIEMIFKYFENGQELNDFLESIEQRYCMEELEDTFVMLYCGYGDYTLNEDIKSALKYPLFECKADKLSFERELIEKPSLEQWERKMLKKSVQAFSPLIKLTEEAFIEYFLSVSNKSMFDTEIFVGKNNFAFNKIKIMARSEFFWNLFSASKNTQNLVLLNVLDQQNRVIYEILFNFLQSDWLVISDNISADTYLQLIRLADYFCIPVLTQLCCNELLGMLNTENVEKILTQSIKMKLSKVIRGCCDFWIKKTLQTVKIVDIKAEIKKTFESTNAVQQLESMMEKMAFELIQAMMQNQKTVPNFKKKASSNNFNMEKENYEANVYNN